MDRNEYLDIVAAQIRCKRAVPYLKEELEDHIQDQKDAYIAEGMNSFEAEIAAVKEMGDPVETGVQLDQVHRPKMEWKVLTGAVLMGLIGLAVQFVIARGYESSQSMDWYIGLMSRQIIGMAVGIIIMIIFCYIDYTVLIKWALPGWLLLQAAIVYFVMCGNTVNGRSQMAMKLAYFVIPFYAGLVYRFRTERMKGVIKSVVCLVISVLTVIMIADLASAVTILLCGMIIISIAVYHNWYNVNRKKFLIGLWGSFTGAGLYIAGTMIYQIIQGEVSYRTMRLTAWLSGEAGDYILQLVSETVGNVKAGKLMEDSLFEYVRNDYVWTYLFEYLGTWKGLLLLGVLVLFLGLVFAVVRKQKNRLGYLVGMGCILYLGIQSFIYVAMNFEMIPFAGNYMPFFSNGMMPMIITYFYMGILLSIFRNTNVVRN